MNGVRINYKIAGTGPAVVLLHGYTQTSHMWLPLIPRLSPSYTVIAPDLRGIGGSERTAGGYDKKTMAKDILRAGASPRPQAGDGSRARHRADGGVCLRRAISRRGQQGDSDGCLPARVGEWTTVWLLRDLWHFHFYGETPLALVKGRERIYFEHFWNDFAADRTKSIPERDRKLYAAAYARDDGMRAGFEVFKSFEQDAKDFAAFASRKLEMPFLVLTGEKARHVPHRADQARRRQRYRRGGEGLRALAHGGGARPGDPGDRGLPEEVNMWKALWKVEARNQ